MVALITAILTQTPCMVDRKGSRKKSKATYHGLSLSFIFQSQGRGGVGWGGGINGEQGVYTYSGHGVDQKAKA